VDGHFVPEGVSYYDFSLTCHNVLLITAQTQVFSHHYTIYRSPSHFALASEFHPERWLGTDPRFAQDQLDGVRPFGLGPRMCIGMK
jgi:cytochrome P450